MHTNSMIDDFVNEVEKFIKNVDEFEIGTPQKGEQGRSKSTKKIRT